MDTNSPEYLAQLKNITAQVYEAGVRAGRRSFRLSVLVDAISLIDSMELPALPGLVVTLPNVSGLFLRFTDTLPDFLDYPDQ